MALIFSLPMTKDQLDIEVVDTVIMSPFFRKLQIQSVTPSRTHVSGFYRHIVAVYRVRPRSVRCSPFLAHGLYAPYYAIIMSRIVMTYTPVASSF